MLVVLPLILTLIFMLFAGLIFNRLAEGDVFPCPRFYPNYHAGRRLRRPDYGYEQLYQSRRQPHLCYGHPDYRRFNQYSPNFMFLSLKSAWGSKGRRWQLYALRLFLPLTVLYYYLSGRSLLKIRLKNLKPQLPRPH